MGSSSSVSSSVRVVVRSVEDVSLLLEVVDDEEGPSTSVVSGALVLVIV
ncbi:MAG: hypothetical protein ACXWZ2_12995 [Mycobacterium sp.]